MVEVSAVAAPPEAAGRLEHFPISFFAMIMGTAGLSLATHQFEHKLGFAPGASLYIAALAASLFVIVSLIYLAKIALRWSAVVGEWHHPVRLSFFPAVSISLQLLSLIAVPLYRPGAEIVWAVGAALHFVFSLAIISAWISHRPFEPPHLNPAWFIPAVGNIFVPLAGVQLGYVEVSWFFFAFGLLFWIVLITLVFNRLIFHNPLPERLLPTLMILVAPPAVAFLAYMRLNGGVLDTFGRVLFYAGLGLFFLVAAQIGRFIRVQFALSWWAYSFPLAALTIASSIYANAVGGAGLTWLFYGLYGLLVLVLTMLFIATLRAVANGMICKPEH